MQSGGQYTEGFVVRAKDCAHEWGNVGLMVLSTPALIGHMESACVSALQSVLEEHEMTVGAAVQMRHLAKADIDEDFSVTVTLLEVQGRRYHFQFEARCRDTVLGDGTHTRVKVPRASQEGG